MAFAGILIGTRAVLDAIQSKRPADMEFDVLSRLVGQMFACRIDDFLLDIGTIENYTHAQAVRDGI